MVISDEYRYIFVELPFTASTAISRELREHYAGKRILHKHSYYSDFLKIASADQKRYFAFSGVRNPLDETVSRFVKLKTDPGNEYSDPEPWVSRTALRRFRWVQQNDASFERYFLKFFHLPSETWSSLDHKRLDYVYRLESVAEDFSKILNLIGIAPLRPLPVIHRTEGKDGWKSYYTPRTHQRAGFVFGPRMEEWGYEFPEEWHVGPIRWPARAIYGAKALGKNSYRRLR